MHSPSRLLLTDAVKRTQHPSPAQVSRQLLGRGPAGNEQESQLPTVTTIQEVSKRCELAQEHRNGSWRTPGEFLWSSKLLALLGRGGCQLPCFSILTSWTLSVPVSPSAVAFTWTWCPWCSARASGFATVQILLSPSVTKTSFAPWATCSLLEHFLSP